MDQYQMMVTTNYSNISPDDFGLNVSSEICKHFLEKI